MIDEKVVNLVVKVLLIIGVVFCALAILFPWISYNAGLEGVEIYTWGAHSSSFFSSDNPAWVFYYSDFSAFSNLLDSEQTSGLGVGMVLLYLVFPLNIISLIAGIFAFNTKGKKQAIFTLRAGIILIVALSLFVIFVQFGLYSIPGINSFSRFFDWSLGFSFVLISIILFFVVYAIQRSMLFVSDEKQVPIQKVQHQNDISSQHGDKIGYCKDCGKELEDDAVFCKFCGARVE